MKPEEEGEQLKLLRKLEYQSRRHYKVAGDSNWIMIGVLLVLIAIAVRLWFF